jgi:glycosyltransferase involved in cell wall biosynthesis
MTDKPVASVVIIFFNAAGFIKEAIESVFAQTYDAWELLLVDDGSTDESTAIAKEYATLHPGQVAYLTHDGHHNRGMSASRNLGVRHARGRYVAFLDADDVWLPDKLAQQVAIMDAYPRAGMVVGATLYWYSWTGRARDARLDHIAPVGGPQDTLIEPPKLASLLRPLGNEGSPSNSSMILRRTAFEGVGGFEEEFRGLFEDQAFLIKIYLTTPVFVASACWDRYRQHANSCCEQAKAEGTYHRLHEPFLCWLERYLLDHGFEGTAAWQALQRALLRYRAPGRFWLCECGTHPWKAMWRGARELLQRVLPSPLYLWLRSQLYPWLYASMTWRATPISPAAQGHGGRERG